MADLRTAEEKRRVPRAPRSRRSTSAASEDSRRGDAPPARSEPAAALAEDTLEKGGKRQRGRPREQQGAVVLSLRLPGELVADIDRVVADSGHMYRDRSEFIRQTLAVTLRQIADPEALEREAQINRYKGKWAEICAKLEELAEMEPPSQRAKIVNFDGLMQHNKGLRAEQMFAADKFPAPRPKKR